MTVLEKKILDIAKKHPDYDEARAIKELQVLSDMDLIEELWKLRDKVGNENRLNLALAYYIGITNSKPTDEFKLEKRRTYGRAGFPDIDMDFDYVRRGEIIEYLIEKYGRDYVGNIGTIQTFKTKAAVRRAVKVSDPENSIRFDSNGNKIKNDDNTNFALENEILQSLPKLMKREDGSQVESVMEAYNEYPSFAKYMDAYPKAYRIARHIEGTISGAGSHAAGIVISPVPLSRIAPLHNTTGRDADGPKKVLATQFPMSDVENLGLIKFDVLGLSTLTAIDWACKSIEDGHDVKIDWNNISLKDEATFDLLKSGKTDGCFQLENRGMKECLRQINIDSFEDLVVAVAMYRPGPKDYIPDFAARKQGKVRVIYAHPLLEKITKPTYSIICYQEQVMQAFMILSGLTASDGYSFIKGCAKKKPEIIEGFKIKFFKGCQNNNIDFNIVNKIWKDLEKFAGYSFNRSHAVSYALISYQTAYLKAHYPTEFITARLSVESIRRNFDDIEKYEKDAIKNFGFTILKPDINLSKSQWSIVEEKKLRKPLLQKGVGIKAADDIVANQPYRGKDLLYSFAIQVGSSVSSKIVEAMKDNGMWKGIDKETLKKNFVQIRKDKKRLKGRPTKDIFA